jgi:wobble nucleotide-excising tRNase
MGITRISRARDFGVLRDFTWPSDLPTFGRFNLIYGWNGSGKTTISKLFRALETRVAPANDEVTLSINGADVRGHEFGQVTLPVRVFNKDFVSESVFPTTGDVAPIFVLGKENVEKQKQVDLLKTTLADEQSKLDTNRQKKSGAATTLDRFCIDKARVIKDTLRSSGSNPYNNYNKSDFAQRAEEMISVGDKDPRILNDTTRDRLLAQIRASPKSKLQPLTYRLPDLEALEKNVADLLSGTVVSAAIESLKNDAKLSLWVHTGLGLHKERRSETCLFCQQTLPKDRLKALEAHFSTEYEDLLRKLGDQIATIQAAIKTATDLSIPKSAELYEHLSSESESAATALRGECESAKRALETLVKALEAKKSRAFERVSLEVSLPVLNAEVVANLNAVIQKHNQVCDEFHSGAQSARKQLEADSVATAMDEFVMLRDAVQTAEGGVKETEDETRRLNTEIAKLERDIVDHLRSAEELNDDLRKYLGHGELRLEVKQTGYTIMRHDSPADSLSEGETTGIALLYFLKSLKDRRFELRRGVVVLDDPVSSLDANSLYLAFGLIRQRTQNAAQLFILTHNFTFFREVRNWFHSLKGQDKKNRRFYMLECAYDGDQRCSSLRPLDPLLEQYESEYHYLFARIYRAAGPSSSATLEESYLLPNMARRLLEAFLAFRQPQFSRELWQKLRDVDFDEAKKLRMYRFLNIHSHGNTIGEPEHDPSLLGEARSVLQDLLELIKAQDAEHFAAMAKLAEPPAEEGDEK